jgi:hypothetical protein
MLNFKLIKQTLRSADLWGKLDVGLRLDLFVSPHEVDDVRVDVLVGRVQHFEVIEVQGLDMLGKFDLH